MSHLEAFINTTIDIIKTLEIIIQISFVLNFMRCLLVLVTGASSPLIIADCDNSSPISMTLTNRGTKKYSNMICTLFTGHPVRRVFSCVTVMSIS